MRYWPNSGLVAVARLALKSSGLHACTRRHHFHDSVRLLPRKRQAGEAQRRPLDMRTSRKARCRSETWPESGDAVKRRRWDAAEGYGPSIFLPFNLAASRLASVPVPPAVPSSSRRGVAVLRASLPHADHQTRRPDQQSQRLPCWPLGDRGFHCATPPALTLTASMRFHVQP